jgi:hypothetical protein
MHTFEQRNAVMYYRRAFAEMPVGDPMSGAPYGEHLKSKGVGMIIGVVAAVAAVFTGGATLAAYAAGEATLGAAIAAGAMVAGGVMTGVGAVTGNKKLMKIGGVLTLAGGLGSLAASAMSGTASGAASAGGSQAEMLAAQTSEFGAEGAAMTNDALTSSGMQKNLFNSMKGAGIDSGSLSVDAAQPATADMASTANAQPVSNINNLDASVPDGTFNLNTDKVPMTGLDNVSATPAELSVSAPQTTAPQVQPSTPAPDGLNVAQNTVDGKPIPNSSYADTQGGILNNAWETAKSVGKGLKDYKEIIDVGGKMLMSANDPENELIGSKQALYDAQAIAAGATANANNETAASIKQRRDLEAQQAKNANTQILMLDPRSPTYAADKAAAQAKGIQTQDYVVPGTSGPITAGKQQWSQASQSPNMQRGILRG